ncbi:hypothetical protein EC960427_3032B, partial [Escherichia coli 96.0427]
GQM